MFLNNDDNVKVVKSVKVCYSVFLSQLMIRTSEVDQSEQL